MVQRIKTGMIADGAVTTAKMNDEVENLFSFRNRIINGDMRIDQRNNGSAAPATGAQNNAYGVDRFYTRAFGGAGDYPAGTLHNSQRSTDAPPGFSYSLRVTAAQNIAYPVGGARLGAWIQQPIEADNVLDLLNGSGGTVAFTISFWAKASKTGVVSVSVECYNVGGSYCTTVNINQANTWEYKTVTIPAQNSYNFSSGNGNGLELKIGLASNTSWLVSTLNQWNNGSTSRGVLASTQTNFLAATNDYLAITGVQLEAGSTVTPFERRPYGLELSLCERYYQIISASNHRFFTSTTATSGVSICVESLRTEMRTTPSITSSGGASGVATGVLVRVDNNTSASRAINFDPTSVRAIRFYPEGTTTSVLSILAGMPDLFCSAEF
jgi:hypothetical protein